MNIKVTVKRKLIVNGKEYGSPEEMPEDLRRAYERAVGGELGAAVHAQANSKITFQGKEYATPADMPQDVRKLYELALAAANLAQSQSSDTAAAAKPRTLIERNGVLVPAAPEEKDDPTATSPRGFSIQLNIGKNGLLLVLAVLLLVLWYALSGPSTHIR